MDKLIIGSHVGMSSPDYFLGAVKDAASYNATTFMFYTGAPQNSIRKPVNELKPSEGLQALLKEGMDPSHIVVHAPYLINLGNGVNPDIFDLGIKMLVIELQRVSAFGLSLLVLHPGAHMTMGTKVGLDKIVEGLNKALQQDGTKVKIALETMAGKGTELGTTFEEIRYIIDHCQFGERLGVCLDTCHISDAGYDVFDVDGVLSQFDKIIGLSRLLVLHVNDSKNVPGARKDRHENLGYGTIGFPTLAKYIHHPLLSKVPKILETPWVGDKPPYKEEIAMLRNNSFISGWREKL